MSNKLLRISLGLMLAAVMPLANAIPANNLTLSSEPSPGIQQSDQGRCIFGESSCDSFELGSTEFPKKNGKGNGNGNGNSIDYRNLYSPEYNVGDFRALVGDQFSIGIDINAKNNGDASHFLTEFVALIGGKKEFGYFCDRTQNSCDLSPKNNPGNGYSDWFLSGFDLSNFSDGQTLEFGLTLLEANAGGDQFFIIDEESDNEVPEPGLLGLLGLGLIGLGVSRRRQRAS